MLVPLTVGGAILAAVMAILMIGFALVRGFVEELLLYPVTTLSAAMVATTGAISTDGAPILVVIDLGAVLIIAGTTLLYLDRMVAVAVPTPHSAPDDPP
jgi:hypothetical protein